MLLIGGMALGALILGGCAIAFFLAPRISVPVETENAKPSETRSKAAPQPNVTQKYIIESLTNAREDLLSIKRENLSCEALSAWQARATIYLTTEVAMCEVAGDRPTFPIPEGLTLADLREAANTLLSDRDLVEQGWARSDEGDHGGDCEFLARVYEFLKVRAVKNQEKW
jgi:hypothetical protein